VTDCPNSTEGGCRCPSHHPGLGYQADTGDHALKPVRLSLVTTGPPEPSTDELLERLLRNSREACATCVGDASRCQNGTGEPAYRRLPGCVAFDDNGDLQLIKAPPPVRQPWDPRPARHAA
jgi:hypothetical protein